MVPCVSLKEYGFAAFCQMDFACGWVADGHFSLQDIKNLIGSKNGAEIIGLAEGTSNRQAEYKHMDLAAGNINPVCDLASYLIAPQVARYGFVWNGTGAVECRPWGW
jgi:hypothetical protein